MTRAIDSRTTRVIGFVLLLFAARSFAAEKRNEFRYHVGPGAAITLVNQFGPVTVQPSPGHDVVVVAITRSDKVAIDCTKNADRVEARTRILQRIGDDDARVDYQVQVPIGAAVSIRSATGALSVRGLKGDLSVQSDSAQVDIRDLKNTHLQVRTVSGPVTLTNVSGSYIDIASVGGPVTLSNVAGPHVTVNTSDGPIRYTGNPGTNGAYSLMNHSGNIDVILPAGASVDLTARSVTGSVQNDFPLQPNTRASFNPTQGRALSGLANAGSSSMHLTSFSGTIAVRKQ